MTDIKQWIDERGLYEEDYLGDLCKSNHEYLNTGKSIRAKPTNRKNGRCVCCKKVQSDKHYINNKEYYISKATKRNQTFEGSIANREQRSRQKFRDNNNFVEKINYKNIINKINVFNNKCAYCGVDLDFFDIKQKNWLEIDHIVSKKNNGTHTLKNIIPSCRSCNQSKKNMDMKEWFEKQTFFSEIKLTKIQNT
tara:strand:+ start:60 stop:641 length:582 start_codon:yes stop_codon:yes gene_type:complete